MQKLYDSKTLSETHHGDTVFITHIVHLFVHHMPLLAAELKRAYASRDWQNIYFYAHKMKASIDLFGVTGLASTIRSIEQQGKAATDTETLSHDIDHVSDTIDECSEQLKLEFQAS